MMSMSLSTLLAGGWQGRVQFITGPHNVVTIVSVSHFAKDSVCNHMALGMLGQTEVQVSLVQHLRNFEQSLSLWSLTEDYLCTLCLVIWLHKITQSGKYRKYRKLGEIFIFNLHIYPHVSLKVINVVHEHDGKCGGFYSILCITSEKGVKLNHSEWHSNYGPTIFVGGF